MSRAHAIGLASLDVGIRWNRSVAKHSGTSLAIDGEGEGGPPEHLTTLPVESFGRQIGIGWAVLPFNGLGRPIKL